MANQQLAVATFNLEDGRRTDLLPDVVAGVPGLDILFLQFSDHRARCNASDLRLCVADMSATLIAASTWPAMGVGGLSSSLTTRSRRQPFQGLLLWGQKCSSSQARAVLAPRCRTRLRSPARYGAGGGGSVLFRIASSYPGTNCRQSATSLRKPCPAASSMSCWNACPAR